MCDNFRAAWNHFIAALRDHFAAYQVCETLCDYSLQLPCGEILAIEFELLTAFEVVWHLIFR